MEIEFRKSERRKTVSFYIHDKYKRALAHEAKQVGTTQSDIMNQILAVVFDKNGSSSEAVKND